MSHGLDVILVFGWSVESYKSCNRMMVREVALNLECRQLEISSLMFTDDDLLGQREQQFQQLVREFDSVWKREKSDGECR